MLAFTPVEVTARPSLAFNTLITGAWGVSVSFHLPESSSGQVQGLMCPALMLISGPGA